MKTIPATAAFVTLLSCMTFINLVASEKDAKGCKDLPLVPRMEGYYIAGCGNQDADAEFDVSNGNVVETVHVVGKSAAVAYTPQPDLKQKPTAAQLKGDFEKAMKLQGATLAGTTPGQMWPVYKLLKDGKEYWIVLLVDPGEYFTGSYAVRVIERTNK